VDDFVVFDDDATGFAVEDFLTGGKESFHGYFFFSGMAQTAFTAGTSGEYPGDDDCTEDKQY
jgi:hypothetical protein